MPRTVTAPRGSRTYSNQQWGMLMKLAYDHGWRPIGCEPPDDWNERFLDEQGVPRRFFSMDYFSRNGQQVLAADAAAMADALESALDDVPTFDALELKVSTEIHLPHLDRPLRALRPGAKVNPYEFFSGPNRVTLLGFIAYCRGGGFRIT